MELVERIRKAGKVLIIGNGGSWANAEHISCDLLNCGIPAFTMNAAQFSAFANDNGYYNSFSHWVSIVGNRGDLLIALSGSGKSPNIQRACDVAKLGGMDVYQEFGAPQGFDMQASEERQIWLGHELMRQLKRANAVATARELDSPYPE